MKFKIENGPHIKGQDSTSKIMMRLLIALMPIVCYAIFKNTILVYFATKATIIEALHPVFMILTGVLTSLISEILYIKFILKNTNTLTFKELSKSFAFIPGLFLALVLPVNTPLWLVAIGAISASIIGKMIFGGFGQNIFNPALVGYLLISSSYSVLIGNYFNLYELDTIASATPLTNLSDLSYYGTYEMVVGNYGTLFNFLSGTIPGALGEVSKILIIFAFIYLVITKTIKWKIPVLYVSTVFFMTYIIGSVAGLDMWYPVFHILSGGLLFGAVFMATDPVTSPTTSNGQILYGISLGIMTVIFRFLTSYPEGVMTSILLMNLFVPVFDKIGLKMRNNKDKNNISYILIFLLISLVVILISNNILTAKNNVNQEEVNKVKIISIEKINNKTKYVLQSKGWDEIKAEVEVIDKEIKSIIITDNSGETQWNEIEKANYIYKLIANQNNIDDLDAISGSTKTSEGLKNIVKKVKMEEK